MSCPTTSSGVDIQYALTINIENHKAAGILNNNAYRICVGYPEDDKGFDTTVIGGKALNFDSSTPVKVTFSARAAAAVHYSIGYAKEFNPNSEVLQAKEVKLGQVYRLDNSGVAKIEDASWVPSDALGFENSISASPIVLRRTEDDPGPAPTRYRTLPVWVPGRGLITPPTPSMSVKVWLESDSTAEYEDDDLGTHDISEPFRVKFRKGNPTAIILFKQDGTFSLNSLRIRA
ncbi:uncharacterized protein Z520_01444 [Fonsecaea multimorphosa CBS 102226]|uniref:Uncharacterized protein n=1 Tax=Fonsecaea multimorphosa CBS 102226 TaxID=1442371 RepID=A0A0D2L1Q8_9EURO|nr:uncharacterized protein Z520_01444 [Fonsecaea multimorphosa CBS 102226]KIY02979.1 hypothetical protein Z520_01444 [Fonsecaea multimorphosa CBS 102226]OAL30809.1 hypothetical protein AYO22_01429 [Fonsecaea multimorphosa]